MEADFLIADESKFYLYKRWMRIDAGNEDFSLLDRKETQELIDFLQKHLKEVRE